MRFDMRLIALWLMLLAAPSICIASESITPSSTAPAEIARKAIIMLKPGQLDFGSRPFGTLSEAVAVAPSLRAVMEQFPVERIERAFPEASSAPRIRRNADGVEFRDTDISLIYEVLVTDSKSRDALVERLKGVPGVVYAEADFWAESRMTPNDPSFTRQWGMQNIGQYGGTVGADIRIAPVWTTHRGSNSEILAIVDGGTEQAHSDFTGRVSGAVGSDRHATHVTGIAAATGNNALGVAGVNWQCAIRSDVKGDANQSAGAIRGAVDAGAKVLNNSWGQDAYCSVSLTIEAALAYAYKSNALSVFAMPETGHTCDWPNGYEYYGAGIGTILNVGAADYRDQVATYSFAKPYSGLVAPGGELQAELQEVYSTFNNNGYGYLTGTSMATPHVSGAASLLRSYATSIGRSLYNDDVAWLLKYSATDLNTPGFDETSGWGRLNVQRAADLLSAPNIFIQETANGGTVVSQWSNFQTVTFYQLPGQEDGNYLAKRYTVERDVTFGVAFPSVPKVWERGVATIGYNGSTSNFCVGHTIIIPGTVTPTGCRVRTFVYEVLALDGQPLGWFPTTPAGVKYAFSELYIAPINTSIPSATTSYYVPMADVGGVPNEGPSAVHFFRACPNNDGGASLPANARVKVVVNGSNGLPLANIAASDVYMVLNGGTPEQGFTGQGADSIIANSQYNQAPLCPDVRIIPADGPTDGSGVTYITFTGSSGTPGVGARDATRKWGHYDSTIPVYVLGQLLSGRITSADVNGSYVLRIKNFDWTGGLGTQMNQGESVTGTDYNGIANGIGVNNAISYWKDFDSQNGVDAADLNMITAHLNHDCDSPNNP
jgi:subtilisin family serine protease